MEEPATVARPRILERARVRQDVSEGLMSSMRVL